MKIYITGCAKSGTTLLFRLFGYFENVELLRPNEVKLKKLVNFITQKNNVAVGKRRLYSMILSLDQSIEKLKSQEKIILDNDIKILNIVRDGRDIILSNNYKVSPERWISCIKQREMFKDIITMEIKYEDLIYDPDHIQKDIAKTFGLKLRNLFSDYPNGLDEKYFINTNNPIYKPRPIDKSSIHKDLEAYKKICPPNKIQLFERCLDELNYK